MKPTHEVFLARLGGSVGIVEADDWGAGLQMYAQTKPAAARNTH
ncbi:hypothetical protein [Acetobacter tropicalis]|uniref:Uncharacterized protein n=1 Tax=Acetobacter tropicalis TaxID=104102 RepID=A0A511FPK5_9PROT|nr:hypothetical protein [Acetobacter tropicalis]GEL50872.1 hypothetical protein ATR01nite_19470 [Acetobacter tropicalis]